MIQFMLSQNGVTQVGGIELLQQWQKEPGSWIWVDLHDEPINEEMAFLNEHFPLDDVTVAEAQRMRHPPSFEVFDNYIYLLLKPLDAESDTLDFNTLQLAMFAGDRFLVTRRSKESPYLATLWQNLVDNGSAEESPLSVVASMSNRVAQRYGRVLLNLEQRLDIIEEELFDTSTDTLMKELVSYNTGLRKMHRILTYYVDVFSRLRKHLAKTKNPLQVIFDDIFSIIERFNTLADLYQNLITDLIDAYISLNGHRLNQIMKVLTIVTVIFVPLTLLVGIYGMNFENIPELKSQHGYYILLSVMAGISATLLYVFRRKRWL